MQDARNAVWSIPYVSVAFFLSLKHNFIAYRSSKVSSRPDCIFEIDQLWQSGFSRVYSNCCCSCSFEAEIIKIGQSSHKMHSNKIMNFQESTTILNAWKKSGNLLKSRRIYMYVYKTLLRGGCETGSTFKCSTAGLNSGFFFPLEQSLWHGKKNTIYPAVHVKVWREWMDSWLFQRHGRKTDSSWIWTRIIESISYNNNRHIKCALNTVKI